jgi:tRNA dimethylallyltransferase
MWADGLLDEVRGLERRRLGVTAARAIGYAQALSELDGDYSRDQAIGEASALTRRYARRQVGWFRRYPQAHWFDADDARLADSVLATIDR